MSNVPIQGIAPAGAVPPVLPDAPPVLDEAAQQEAKSLGQQIKAIGTDFAKASGKGKMVMVGGSVVGLGLMGDGARRAFNALEKDPETGERDLGGAALGVGEALLGVATTVASIKSGRGMVR